ncbi:hypothetical protein CFP75_38335 [Amycolatopsis alba DSM 44262]|uniref:Uncharacterized protein n=1 Tax=Amycolatopsis alba DSM 44262 TaxID=1125972 RepID=A0A229RA00_AMYAL|nr:hypothetical protein CFP75_38335 [Amycolatopsis alba DSM 44262]
MILALLLGLLSAVGLAAGLVIANSRSTSPTPADPRRPSAPGKVTTLEPEPSPEPGWDVVAQKKLALRPMLRLPGEAAQPHPLSPQAGPELRIPEPTYTTGAWIPGGFPGTAEGALAQLKAADEIGLRGGDPAVYDRAYADIALSGAPVVDRTGLHTLLKTFRMRAGIAPGESKPGLTVTYDVTHGQIKGTTDQGRYAVVCVLGILTFDYKGQSRSMGVGDCQAMRWTGDTWRISTGNQAAMASNAWPGSTESVQAGYRSLGGAPR